jgi:hypothetical protein
MERELVHVGERVRDYLGHWYDVLEVSNGGYRLRVQPLTMVGTPAKFYPLGDPVWGYRSEFRKDGE